MRPSTHLPAGLALACLLGGTSCDSSKITAAGVSAGNASGRVLTSWGAPVAGARVYLIPAQRIVTTPITSASVLSGVAGAYDEPLEDLIASTLAGSFPQVITGANGAFQFPGVDTTLKYYPYVDIANATPANLYPGGSLSRVARSGAALHNLQIEITGHPTPAATYVGSSTCITCHQDYAAQAKHAHRLGFRQPGVTTALQDLERKPDFDAALASFKDATPATAKANGTPLWYSGYDATRGFDKFIVTTAAQGGAEIQAFLWKDTTDGKYKITLDNLATPSDPDRTFEVDLTYGGALYKQRFMIKPSGAGYAGRYPFLQYQHAGDDSYYERTRKQWRDYHMDWHWDAANDLFADPPKTKNIESTCLACHTTGYRAFPNQTTGERMCDGVNDPAGAFDIDSDGVPDEINTGCEVCHGKGSEHVAAQSAQYIVKPSNLSPERESQICGFCHDRVAGNDDLKNDQPLNSLGEMPRPGVKRSDFLLNHTSRKGPKLSSFWTDEVHSKSHHQQYSDFIKSKHYRNNTRLLVCSDCHDLHGMGDHDGELKRNPNDGSLCSQCHVVDLSEHLLEYAGSRKTGQSTSCVSCHYYKTAKTGAGRRGILLGTPTGGASDAEITYWENDISSHLTVVPKKTNAGVRGKTPGSAMPAPYVNACGTCHDATNLKYQR